MLKGLYSDCTSDVHLVLNGADISSGSVPGNTTSVNISKLGVSVALGSILDLVVNDAMFVCAKSYVLSVGDVAIVCFRGTEPTNVINWLADATMAPSAIMPAVQFIPREENA